MRGLREKGGLVAPLQALLVLAGGGDWDASAAAVGQTGVTTKAGRSIRPLFRSSFLAAVAAVALSVLVLLPDWFRRDQWTPFVQIVAFRPILAAATVVVGMLMLARRWARPSATALLVSWRSRQCYPAPSPALRLPLVVGTCRSSRSTSTTGEPMPPCWPRSSATAVRTWWRFRSRAAFRVRLDHELAGQGCRWWSSVGPGEPDIVGVTALAAPSVGPVHVELGGQTLFPYVELSGGAFGRLRLSRSTRWRRYLD